MGSAWSCSEAQVTDDWLPEEGVRRLGLSAEDEAARLNLAPYQARCVQGGGELGAHSGAACSPLEPGRVRGLHKRTLSL